MINVKSKMKFLLCLSTIIFVSSVTCIRVRQKENTNIIIKLSENYYNKIGHENINEFKNMLFKELDQKTPNNMTLSEPNHDKGQSSNRTEVSMRSNIEVSTHKTFIGEYVSTNRIIKFYISHSDECSIYINDTVSYENLNSVNFVEHMILHNNAENIDPKGVYSEDININFFAFNKKLNIFSVYFEPKKLKVDKNDYTLKNFTIEYEYEAINLIKSNIVKRRDSLDNSTIVTNFNSFIWKILNQNILKTKEQITIELYFDVGKEFQHEEVEFSLNFTKSIIEVPNKSIVKYEWKGVVDPQDVLVMETKFPLYFEQCGNLSINLVMIFVGSIFIIFLIGMLYIILSTIFSEDLF